MDLRTWIERASHAFRPGTGDEQEVSEAEVVIPKHLFDQMLALISEVEILHSPVMGHAFRQSKPICGGECHKAYPCPTIISMTNIIKEK